MFNAGDKITLKFLSDYEWSYEIHRRRNSDSSPQNALPRAFFSITASFLDGLYKVSTLSRTIPKSCS